MVRKKSLPSGAAILYIPFLKYEKIFIPGWGNSQFCRELSRFVTRQQVSRIMGNVDKNAPVPDGKTKYYTTKQQPATEQGHVGYKTEWVEWQKEVPYETPKKP